MISLFNCYKKTIKYYRLYDLIRRARKAIIRQPAMMISCTLNT